MSLGQEVLSRLPRALACEWLVLNGLGGFASGTAAGANTRPTHGYLVVVGPGGHVTTVLLKVEERASNDEGSFELACTLRPNGTARPFGHRFLEAFDASPWPTWRYRLGRSVVTKSLMPIYEHPALAISYRLLEGPPVRLAASPLVVARPAEGPTPGAADAGSPDASVVGASVQGIPGRVRVQTGPDAPTLSLWHNGAFMPTRAWQRVSHPDGDNGGEIVEHAMLPGYVESVVTAEAPLLLVAAAEEDLFRSLAQEMRLGEVPPRSLADCIAAIEADERERLETWDREAITGATATARQAASAREKGRARRDGNGASAEGGVLPEVSLESPERIAMLARILNSGLVRRERRLTLWTPPGTTERCVDALRAVAGLLSLMSFDAARDVLRGALDHLNEGRAPERWDSETPIYGDAAPALWLVIAGERYARRSQDIEFVRDALYPALEEVMRSYRGGAPGGIRVDADGLLVTGTGEDSARRSDLNTLWYQSTVAMSQLARMAGRRENAAFYLAWAREHQERFNARFWDESNGRLYDSLRDDEPVEGLLAAQILAVSLSPMLLPQERAMTLLATIERDLAAPHGLRVAADSSEVRVEWLGPLLSAHLRANGRSAEAQAEVQGRIAAVFDWLEHEGVGNLPTLAAAELVRFMIEDLEHAPAGTSAMA